MIYTACENFTRFTTSVQFGHEGELIRFLVQKVEVTASPSMVKCSGMHFLTCPWSAWTYFNETYHNHMISWHFQFLGFRVQGHRQHFSTVHFSSMPIYSLQLKLKVKARDFYLAPLTWRLDRPRFTIIGSSSWLARANGAAASIARTNEVVPATAASELTTIPVNHTRPLKTV